MVQLPEKLMEKIAQREAKNALRELVVSSGKVDFASNDYLGIARNEDFHETINKFLDETGIPAIGATGSRLLTGNNLAYEEAESFIEAYHESEAALIFNSGYDANLGFFSSVPQRDDLVLYDEFVHASIRDGISMGKARHFKYKHNDLEDLRKILERYRNDPGNHSGVVYIATESVFSMDGDSPDLRSLAVLSHTEGCLLVVDEAHAVGIYGPHGSGLVCKLGLEDKVFARVVTFGKALGCHGAAVLGPEPLKQYLVNFARSLIYSTALPPHSVFSVYMAYKFLSSKQGQEAMNKLRSNIDIFRSAINKHRLDDNFIPGSSAIQSCLIPGNNKVKAVADMLQIRNFDVRPILSPSVPESKERLRFCLHTHNTEEEIDEVIKQLANFLKRT